MSETVNRLNGGRRTSRAAVAIGAGLVLQLLTIAAVLLATGAIEEHLRGVYAQYRPDQAERAGGIVVTYLLVVGVLGAAGWLLTAWAHRRRTRWTRVLAWTFLVLGTLLAVTNLAITEYGSRLVPLWLGVAGLVPSLAGLAAVTLLHRER
ncbi:hypothetical protein [Amycolatopsis viridis]|uniref:Integral membrane protein n=1 Tax=Amycolatopsis viridis TaxID=185678 RepID=A0ABX0SUH3_9PSEU|nr:hypothetical protein [Amycolatopsis viridis]NIH78981.1 hypothetical protein [Amycolatopsis viridis]